MNTHELITEWRVSLWFAMLSPLLGILVGMLTVFLFQLKGINNESNETWRQEPREMSKMVSAATPCA